MCKPRSSKQNKNIPTESHVPIKTRLSTFLCEQIRFPVTLFLLFKQRFSIPQSFVQTPCHCLKSIWPIVKDKVSQFLKKVWNTCSVVRCMDNELQGRGWSPVSNVSQANSGTKHFNLLLITHCNKRFKSSSPLLLNITKSLHSSGMSWALKFRFKNKCATKWSLIGGSAERGELSEDGTQKWLPKNNKAYRH